MVGAAGSARCQDVSLASPFHPLISSPAHCSLFKIKIKKITLEISWPKAACCPCHSQGDFLAAALLRVTARAGHCVHPPSSEPCSGRHGATGLVVCHSPSPILEAGGAQVEPQTLAPWSSSRAQPSHPHTMGSSSAGMSVQSTI